MLIRNCPGVSLFQKITRVASGVPSAIRAAREVSEPSGRNFVRYRVDTWESAHPRVQLTYDRYAEHLDYPVFLETSLSQFGGLRWWFQCPLCRRRVQKLFLPPRASRFACRHCHNLSYATRNPKPEGQVHGRTARIAPKDADTSSTTYVSVCQGTRRVEKQTRPVGVGCSALLPCTCPSGFGSAWRS
jgi:hypothetical protein